MKVDLTAKMKKDPAEFFAVFEPGDEQKLFWGKSLLLNALANTEPAARYPIAEFLIGKDCLVGPPGSQKHTCLHVLFCHNRHDCARDLVIARWLVEHGVDVNARDDRGLSAIDELMCTGGSDEELAGIYDFLFSLPNLDLTTPNIRGVSPLDRARNDERRAALAARMEEYLNDHPAK